MYERKRAELEKINAAINSAINAYPNAVPQGSIGSTQFQPLCPQTSPHFIQQGGTDYGTLYLNEVKIQEINSRLDKSWLYWCYKYVISIQIVFYYLSLFILVVGGCIYISYKTGFMNDPDMRYHTDMIVKQLSNEVNLEEIGLFTLCYWILQVAWETYQNSLILRAIKRRNITFAKQAVKMMRLYMIVLTIERLWAYIDHYMKYPLHKDEILEMIVTIAEDILYAQGYFWLRSYFGAIRVHKLLAETEKLKSHKTE